MNLDNLFWCTNIFGSDYENKIKIALPNLVFEKLKILICTLKVL